MKQTAGWMLRKCVRMLVLLLLVSAASFFLVSLSPVDPLQSNVGQAALGAMSQEQVEELKEYWGVGTPALERFLSWLSGVLSGDLGTSLLYRRPVAEVVGERFLSSLWLMASAWVLSGVFGLMLGILAGAFKGKWPDRLITGYCMVTASTPSFWIGLVLLLIFSVHLGLFPIGLGVPIGMEAGQVTIADRISHAFLPALTLSLTGISSIALHTRAKMADIMESPYVLYARARGESERQIVVRHGLRNVLLPAITLQFASISEIFGGSVLVEQVFSYPGLGQAAVTAGLGSDVPLLLGITLISAVFVFAGNLTADLLYRAVDPRMGGFRAENRRRSKSRGSADREHEERKRAETNRKRENGKLIEAFKRIKDKRSRNRSRKSGTYRKRPAKRPGRTASPLWNIVISASVLLFITAAGAALSEQAGAADFARKNLPPQAGFLFGTDWLGRDMFARTLAGLSLSIRLGLVTAFLSALAALVLGTASAMGKWADRAVSGLIDLIMGIPHMLLLILISYACGKGFTGAAAGIALTHWPSLARVIRAEALQIRESQYVKISARLGMSRLQIIRKHIAPHLLSQFMTGLILTFPHAVLHEASITFLGFGLPPEEPSVGMILSESMRYLITGKWWLALFPGLALTGTVLLFESMGRQLGGKRRIWR